MKRECKNCLKKLDYDYATVSDGILNVTVKYLLCLECCACNFSQLVLYEGLKTVGRPCSDCYDYKKGLVASVCFREPANNKDFNWSKYTMYCFCKDCYEENIGL